MSAVANPQQQASTNQLGSILGVAQQVAGNQGIDSNTTQTVMSLLGGYVRSSLQNQQASQGSGHVQSLVNQFSGLGSNPQAVSALFPGGAQQQVSENIAQQTGLNAGTIQSMLPVLVPLVLNLLQSGSAQQGGQSAGNPVLNAFLDADRDGDVDVGDVMGMAGQFLNQQR
ncbi:DUF937 domain-containing protein [Leptolyngbya sp. NIES-2104]|uniref:DUF937 domain-containing protein n=1 Tax=Leptolyngbya sp. NIES-2104 TaxID=1552121 RepID=UPI0021F22023|nr:DUF937 domain-containing protein [Leptolyngbya sp. NIES-2104]